MGVRSTWSVHSNKMVVIQLKSRTLGVLAGHGAVGADPRGDLQRGGHVREAHACER